MSGPKSSRYTLTAAQRRALAEQLERERQLRIQAERDERQRNENFSLYSDVDALVKQNNRLIDDANQVQQETEMKVVSAGNVQSTTKLLGERAKAICNQIRNVQGNELLEQKQSLIEIKSTLRTLYSELNNDISEVQSQHRKQLESVINNAGATQIPYHWVDGHRQALWFAAQSGTPVVIPARREAFRPCRYLLLPR